MRCAALITEYRTWNTRPKVRVVTGFRRCTREAVTGDLCRQHATQESGGRKVDRDKRCNLDRPNVVQAMTPDDGSEST